MVRISKLLKLAAKMVKKTGKPVTILLPPGKYKENIRLSEGVHLDNKDIKENTD